MAKSIIVANAETPDLDIKFGSDLSELQGDFFALRSVVEYPGYYPTGDAWGRVRATDTHDYVVKGTKGGPHVPACELIATKLAETVNIPCPTAKIIELANGDLVFGSRVISGLADQLQTTTLLTTPTLDRPEARIAGMASLLSEVYAFDMLINNVDRHDQNYLSIDDNGTRRFYLIDFGRSLFWSEDAFAFPQDVHHTIRVGRRLRALHGFDLVSALAMLDKLATVTTQSVLQIVRNIPDEWLSPSNKQAFMNQWWPKWHERIQRLRKGFKDGSLL
ncbi:HipA family kinase [Rhizobium sp. BK491]|uniref:HipA family kinase n=1 Tax=Rhizobium sp. BK491 TaxID=2587009 RepID=UPI001615A379|nr:HipA family kinase [Rhizobium sp. BK491]MBB3565985.1 hypothetical protein [Rhizobium sp. BK491]